MKKLIILLFGILICIFCLVTVGHSINQTDDIEETCLFDISEKYLTYATDLGTEYKINNGAIFAKGSNSLQLFGEDCRTIQKEWSKVKNSTNIIHIEAMNGVVMYLTNTGDVYVFGITEYMVDPMLYHTFYSIEKPLHIGFDCKYASLGVEFVLLQKTDNSLWFFGASRNGQSAKIIDIVNPAKKIIDNILFAKAICLSSAWIDTSYCLYMVGDNSYGQIGNGYQGSGYPTMCEDIIEVPYLVLEDVVDIAMPQSYAIQATTKYGATYVWGNTYGAVPKLVK